ncbi:glycerol-3-phosphate dehydrogenase SDP6, mitochondrial [Tanacetum coccineum]
MPVSWRGDDDTLTFSMRSLPIPISWLHSHTENAIAAMAGVWCRYCIRRSELDLLMLYIPFCTFDTYAKVVVNASGPFCDSVRNLADKDAKPMICPSSGVHIELLDYSSPEGMGLIVPKTKDGRVVFMLPWLGRIAGTTESNTIITMLPEPHEDEIGFILDAICDYLNVKVYSIVGLWQLIQMQRTQKAFQEIMLCLKIIQGSSGGPEGDPSMESGDWRVQLQADSRTRVLNKMYIFYTRSKILAIIRVLDLLP